jgi:tRNA threonylcarbamoyladenosine biosynthesis protein TsaB
MKVLALDAATGACSAAVWADGRLIGHRFAVMTRGQAETLMPMVESVLREAGVGFADIDRFGVTVGPGAFTGLRIGLATARGMALSAGRPLIGITTFEAVAHGVPEEERAGRSVVVAVESRRADLYIQCFDPALAPLGPPIAIVPEAVVLPPGPALIAGDAAARLHPDLPYPNPTGHADLRFAAGPGFPDAATVARLVAARIPEPNAGPPAPLYLRPPDATLPAERTS